MTGIESTANLELVSPGLSTTIQDEGRRGWEDLGAPLGGAIDRYAYRCANRLLQNEDTEAVMEAVLQGPTFRSSADVWLATTGVKRISVDGATVAAWSSFFARSGQLVDCRELEAARGYIAVKGGVDVPMVLGSRSTNLEAGFGGFAGRRLQAGDRIGLVSRQPEARSMKPYQLTPRRVALPMRIRVTAGPDFESFSSQSVGTFMDTPYTMSVQSNHVGIRLDGPPVYSCSRGERLSQPMPVGGIQVTPSGQPVVLLASRGTIGGYQLIAVVITPDVWLLGQLQPGQAVIFSEVAFDKAVEITRQALRQLDEVSVK